MDKNVVLLKELQMNTCKDNLVKNQFKVSVCQDEKEVKEVLDQYLLKGNKVSVGGSATLGELNLLDYFKENKDIVYLDRYAAEDPMIVFREAFNADLYVMSSNAVSIDGSLYNVDGNGNRVAALTFGPKQVVVIVGRNKLVRDEVDAEVHMRLNARPANNVRLGKPNPCTKLGYCVDCQLQTRICDNFLVTKRSHFKDRIHVILVNQDLGF